MLPALEWQLEPSLMKMQYSSRRGIVQKLNPEVKGNTLSLCLFSAWMLRKLAGKQIGSLVIVKQAYSKYYRLKLLLGMDQLGPLNRIWYMYKVRACLLGIAHLPLAMFAWLISIEHDMINRPLNFVYVSTL